MMKKTMKLVSGLTLAAAFMFVGFSSFSAPEAAVVDDCGCPPTWTLHYIGNNNNNNIQKFDNNGDNLLCWKDVKGKGNTRTNNPKFYSRTWKDNNSNNPCDD